MLTRTLGFSGFLCLLISLMLPLKDFLLRHVTCCGLLTEVKKSKMKLVPNIFIFVGLTKPESRYGQDCFSSWELQGRIHFLALSSFYRLHIFLAWWSPSSTVKASNIGPSPSHTAIQLVLLHLPPSYKIPFVRILVITLEPPRSSRIISLSQGEMISKFNSI